MSTFSKRHYDAVANVLKNVDNSLGDTDDGYTVERAAGVHEVRSAMAEMFAADNPRFNRETFMKASQNDAVERLLEAFGSDVILTFLKSTPA